jgi:hypothetical protein
MHTVFNYTYVEFWQAPTDPNSEYFGPQKVTFDGENKIIFVNEGELDIDARRDLYSNWKEWSIVRDNLKFPAAMRVVGGDPLPGGDALGSTFFLINGWRIQPWSGNHTEVFNGNLYSDDFDDFFNPADPIASVVIRQTVSNLVDRLGVPSAESNAQAVQDILQDDFDAIPTAPENASEVQTILNDDFAALTTLINNSTSTKEEIVDEVSKLVIDGDLDLSEILKRLNAYATGKITRTGDQLVYYDRAGNTALFGNEKDDGDETPGTGQRIPFIDKVSFPSDGFRLGENIQIVVA